MNLFLFETKFCQEWNSCREDLRFSAGKLWCICIENRWQWVGKREHCRWSFCFNRKTSADFVYLRKVEKLLGYFWSCISCPFARTETVIEHVRRNNDQLWRKLWIKQISSGTDVTKIFLSDFLHTKYRGLCVPTCAWIKYFGELWCLLRERRTVHNEGQMSNGWTFCMGLKIHGSRRDGCSRMFPNNGTSVNNSFG